MTETFIGLTGEQVGSCEMPMPGVEALPTSSTSASSSIPISAPYTSEASSSSYSSSSSSMEQTSHSRPSLPMLHTRMAYPEHESYETSPVEDYTYASNAPPRHDSIPSNYSTEGFRPYIPESMAPSSVNAHMYYEPGAAYSFGNLHAAPGYPSNTSMARLPSVTGDSFSPLNMSSLHSSLPTQTVQERRLPVPYSQQQASYASTEVPQIRPLTSLTEPQTRAQPGATYSRNSMSWSMANPAVSRNASSNGLPTTTSQGHPVMSSSNSESMHRAPPILGYQFSTAGSPEMSPTEGSAMSQSFSSTSSSSTTGAPMLPPPSVRYAAALPTAGDGSRRPSSSQEGSTSLYSFSSGRDAAGSNINQADQQQGYTHLRHLQPQHATSVDGLRRRSSQDQQQQRAATAHRMSVSNLNARY